MGQPHGHFPDVRYNAIQFVARLAPGALGKGKPNGCVHLPGATLRRPWCPQPTLATTSPCPGTYPSWKHWNRLRRVRARGRLACNPTNRLEGQGARGANVNATAITYATAT